jgi:4-oxalocrotonate tautomerase
MPLIRIDLIEGRSAPQVAAISNAIQRALVDCLDVPERDQFQVINEHAPGRLIYNSVISVSSAPRGSCRFF